MQNHFACKFALVTNTGICSPFIEGIMREYGSAAILSTDCKSQIKNVHILWYFRAVDDAQEYVINDCYRDLKRPLSNGLSRTIVIMLTGTNGD